MIPEAPTVSGSSEEPEDSDMRAYRVTLGRPGGGSETLRVVVHAATPDLARRTAESQHPGTVAHAVRIA